MQSRRAIFLLSSTLWIASLSNTQGAVDFLRDVQPIFEKRCQECHDHRKVKGGLRVDLRDAFLRGGDSGKPAVTPGKPDESPLIARILSKNEDEVMPPKGEKLTAGQIATLKSWVQEGASWPDSAAAPKPQWSYVSPQRPPQPSVKQAQWPKTGLDFLVLSKLEGEGISPSPEADRATLIRRVSLDLIGLPPSPAEVSTFEADNSPDAYEKVVDRLLSSVQYGERWARPWLDMARYADTQGYEKDNRRTIWPYRDWVIQALNRNLSFDQFTLEQIAGDLLPNATRDQKVATGFHRNTLTNTEGGTDDEEFRHEAIVDRLNTTFGVWMGTTMNCAQCHNHKYDPITSRDFYGVYAILNQTADADRDDDAPVLSLPSDEQKRRKQELAESIKIGERSYRESTPPFVQAREAWEKAQRENESQWSELTVVSASSQAGAVLRYKEDGRLLVEGTNAPGDRYTVELATPFTKLGAVRIELLPHDTLPEKSFGRKSDGTFVLNQIDLFVAPKNGSVGRKAIGIQRVVADSTKKGFESSSLIAGGQGPGWSIDPSRDPRYLYLLLDSTEAFDSGTSLTVVLHHKASQTNANLGSFRIAATSLATPLTEKATPTKIVAALHALPEQRSEEQSKLIEDHFRATWDALAEVRQKLAKDRSELDQINREIPTTLVMAPVEKPRDTHFRIRGSYLAKGDKVTPSVPAAFPQPAKDQPIDRITFARWLASTTNPLTARVQVNRYWEQFFGRGIVETTEEFGKQGEPPSHQELLDWLATEFMRLGWDMKAIQKTIVMSATYRQTSKATRELAERDPNNRLYARGPRTRLEAEMIRDQALAASGLLSSKVGGPSVMPKQPDGVWQVVYSGDQWKTSPGEDQHRRGIYTFWRRSSPHPMMLNFDAPSREFCVLKRNKSNTPLQALNLLNDAAFIECAQALGRRAMKEGGTDFNSRLRFAFRACVAREPRDAELQRLTKLFESERARFQQDKASAEKMASSQLGALPESWDVSEMAAWTVISNVLLNLDEMITKG